MNDKQLKHFEELLLEERKKIMKELKHFQEFQVDKELGENSASATHMADLGTDEIEREKAYLLATHEGRYLYRIIEALRRIIQGEYGICQECGSNIGINRLEAVPHARFCIECKTEIEQEEKEERKAASARRGKRA